MPTVNPLILRWARESAGFTVANAAQKLGIAATRLSEMETGEIHPTRRQLNNMAAKYRRSLLTFYLAEPPVQDNRTHDFRTLPESEPAAEARVNALLRDIKVRQGFVVDALEDVEENEALPFVGSMNLDQGSETIAEAIADTLQFDLEEYRSQRNQDEAFKVLRRAVEDAGVFVVLMGNLGHHTTNISPHTFRGLALADSVAPFIVINENDSRSAWSFTLLHELAHIFLGESSISGYDSEARVEKICDEVAAFFLLRPRDLQQFSSQLPLHKLVPAISDFAGERKVSRKMVAYNLLVQNQITSDVYRQLSDHFDAEREAAPTRDRRGAPDYYVVRRHRIGSGLNQLVKRLVTSGVMNSTTAGRVLGVKPTAVGKMSNDNYAS